MKPAPRPRRHTRGCPIAVALLVAVAAACSEGDDSPAAATPPAATGTVTTQGSVETRAPATEPAASSVGATTESADASVTTEAVAPPAAGFDVAALGPPAGDPMRIGLVNTEGTPGLDFPDIRIAISAATDYLNEHGGMGGRPIDLVVCTANGSPEASQACAQELVGEGAELVMLGLDLFPDYATYTAANVPVVGVLPILAGDYTADALFVTGGNATVMASIASVAASHFQADTVAIVSADNPGANASEASLTASLDVAGIAHVTVKGGDNETDAGFQGLMREATKDDPDLIVSLYSDAGCIGTMRARASLGITIPAISTGVCAGAAVLDEVGDDAIGWTFSGVSTPQESDTSTVLRTIMAPALGVEPDAVDSSSLGLGALGLFMAMSLAQYSDELASDDVEVTGDAIYDKLASSSELTLWGSNAPIACGASPKYPTICSFVFPFAEYVAGGGVQTIPGLEGVDSIDFLP